MVTTRRIVLFAAAILAAAPLLAQSTKTITAPPGHETLSGGRMTTGLGAYADYRYQVGEGTVRGTAMSISKVDYRAQGWLQYSSYYGMGRSWTRVTLKLSNVDVDKMTTNYQGNISGAQTLVYSGKTAWPTITVTKPKQVWGKQVSFPFTKSWGYSGKTDILFDYEFKGGQLFNRNPNFTGTRLPAFYAMDGAFTTIRTYLSFPPQYTPRAMYTAPLCADSGLAFSFSAYSTLVLWLYNGAHPDTTKAGRAFVLNGTAGTAANAPLMAAFCHGGSATGVAVGAKCHKLHVDLNRLLFLVASKASNDNRHTSNPLPAGGGIIYKNAWAGQTLWLQSAWMDSKTKQFALTIAASIQLPRMPEVLRKAAVWNNRGFLSLSRNEFAQTLPRFTYR